MPVEFLNERKSSEEIERAVLGAVIVDGGECLQVVLQHVRPDDLTSLPRRLALRIIDDLAKDGLDHTDAISINYRASQEVGGEAVLEEVVACVEACGTTHPQNIEHWCKEISKRSAVRALNQAAQRAQDPSLTDPESILREFNEAAADLHYADDGAGTDLRDLVAVEFDRLERIKAGELEDTVILTGLQAFDDGGGLRPGEVWTVPAQPGAGKTALALQIANRVAATPAGLVLFFSLEMTCEELVKRMWCMGSRHLTPRDLRTKDPMDDPKWRDLARRTGEMSESKMRVFDRGTLTVEKLGATARRIGVTQQISLIVVDYLQIMTPSYGDKEHERLAHITRNLKQIAKDTNSTVLLLSQINREGQKRAGDLQVYDIAGSSGPSNDSDGVIFLWRPHLIKTEENPRTAFFDRKKARHGTIKRFEVDFDPQRFTFTDRAEMP